MSPALAVAYDTVAHAPEHSEPELEAAWELIAEGWLTHDA